MIRNTNPISAYNSAIYNSYNSNLQSFCSQVRFVCKDAKTYQIRNNRRFWDQCRDFCVAMSMRKSPIDVDGKIGSVDGKKEEYIVSYEESAFKKLARRFARENKLKVKFETKV